MSIVAVDLAAKYSAACVMDLDQSLGMQVDSWGRTETDFIDQITAPWLSEVDPPLALIVEDLPHGVGFMTITKAVCRLQGRIVERMNFYGVTDAILFVPPALWRARFDGLERGTGPEVVVPVSAALGYTPPDLSHRILGTGDKATARKVATDYCAAYLLARWAIGVFTDHGTFDLPTTSRYGAPPPVRTRKRK